MQYLKDFNSQSLATQAEKEKIVPFVPFIKIDSMFNDKVQPSTEKDTLRNTIGFNEYG